MSTAHDHSTTVLRAGYIAILVNLLLASFKIVVGVLSNSLAVMSDAIHGVIDTLSGIIVVISEKLGTSHKFSKDHSKIERAGAILIAIIILAVGVHILIESIEQFITPEEVDYSIATIIVLIGSIIAKLTLGRYLRATGSRVGSDTLMASSVETINDSIISASVLLSIIVYLIWHVNIEPFVSIAIAILILKFGLEIIFPHLFSRHHAK